MFKFGMIGAGGIADAHAQAIKENDDCYLAMVCDINEEKARRIAEDHHAQFCTDYKEVSDVDAVIINLPHFLHCEVSCYFLSKGIHVLVEKPMANTVEECDRMIAAAKESGVKLAVGHVQKYYSAVRALKEIIESEKYGKLCMINEVRNTDYLRGRPKWFLNKAQAGGGIVMNYGAHSIDRILYTTGLGIKQVTSFLSNPLTDDDVELNAHLLMELDGGVTASITYSGCHTPGEYEITYYFTHGAVKIKNGAQLCIFEDGAWQDLGGTAPLMSFQLKEFIRYLKGENSEVVTPDCGREIVQVLKNIVEC